MVFRKSEEPVDARSKLKKKFRIEEIDKSMSDDLRMASLVIQFLLFLAFLFAFILTKYYVSLRLFSAIFIVEIMFLFFTKHITYRE